MCHMAASGQELHLCAILTALKSCRAWSPPCPFVPSATGTLLCAAHLCMPTLPQPHSASKGRPWSPFQGEIFTAFFLIASMHLGEVRGMWHTHVESLALHRSAAALPAHHSLTAFLQKHAPLVTCGADCTVSAPQGQEGAPSLCGHVAWDQLCPGSSNPHCGVLLPTLTDGATNCQCQTTNTDQQCGPEATMSTVLICPAQQ